MEYVHTSSYNISAYIQILCSYVQEMYSRGPRIVYFDVLSVNLSVHTFHFFIVALLVDFE